MFIAVPLYTVTLNLAPATEFVPNESNPETLPWLFTSFLITFNLYSPSTLGFSTVTVILLPDFSRLILYVTPLISYSSSVFALGLTFWSPLYSSNVVPLTK